jgi:hypothetical protein
MGFPFIAPIKEEVRKKLEARELANTPADVKTPGSAVGWNNVSTLSPFAILSTGAMVVKTSGEIKTRIKSIKDLIKSPGALDNHADAYYGCVISNTTDVKTMYQTGQTIAGYDLNGKPIVVEGEENRRVSTPIIESIDIDSDGNNNTLKTAKVNVRVFTLKQLEMFELFFLRPSMDIVLEFGYNTDIRGEYYNKIDQNLFVGKGYKAWEKRFIEIFSHNDNAYKQSKERYLEILKATNYNYDYFAGKLTNFKFSPDTDGSFNIQLEISSGNELQMWVPLKQSSPTGKISRASLVTDTHYQQWLNVIASDLNLGKLTKEDFPDEFLKTELFNWGVINENEKDTNVSKDPYISFKFILRIMNSSKIIQNYKNGVIDFFYYEDKAKKIPLIPVSSHKNIMSTNSSFILPGYLPFITVANIPKAEDKIILKTNKYNDCHINGKSFNIKGDVIYPKNGDPISVGNLAIGNLYNVFIKYEIFTQIFNESYVQADIINALLAEINSNMFGLCKLELGKSSDNPSQEPLTIIDTKLKNITKNFVQDPQKIYRFKIGPIGSIVREFEFNMEMDELMQGQTMFAAEYDKLKILETGDTDNKRTISENTSNSYADLSFLPNGDGYCSINKVGIQLTKEYNTWRDEQDKATKTNLKGEEKDETEDEQKKLDEVLKGNYIRFKLNSSIRQNTETALNHLIYTDPALIQNYIPKKENGTTVLTFLDITLAIDGMSGLSCGEYFNVDGIPEIYNQNGYFQITNVKHGLNDNDWKTTIEASYLLKSPEGVEDTESTGTNKGNEYKERKVSSTPEKFIPGTKVPQFNPDKFLKDAVSGKGYSPTSLDGTGLPGDTTSVTD